MSNKTIPSEIEDVVKSQMNQYAGDHDWAHITRVRNFAKLINNDVKANEELIDLAAMLHDIADAKLVVDGKTAREKITELLKESYPNEIVEAVIEIVENVSWSKGVTSISPKWNQELHVVQDADRLDALGAIGVARAFTYTGFVGGKLYEAPDKEVRVGSEAAFQHLQRKVLKIKDSLHFDVSKQIATPLHDFVKTFSDQFLSEWGS